MFIGYLLFIAITEGFAHLGNSTLFQ